MRKVLLIALIFTISSVAVFGGSEIWMSIGFEYGNFFEHASDSVNTVDSYMTSPGIAFSSYTFLDKKYIGLFIHDSFLFPNTISTTINGITTNVDLDNYDFNIQLGFVVGPGFRYSFNKNMKLYYGIGLSFLETVSISNYYGMYSMLSFNFGIGADFGLKYDISDSIYFDVGTILNYDFKNYTSVSSSSGDFSAWSNSNYRMISVRPYICIGFNFYKSNEGFGKP